MGTHMGVGVLFYDFIMRSNSVSVFGNMILKHKFLTMACVDMVLIS